ncbi:transcriptional regulator [Saccharothrix xinjiangensis]|uniref:Transcriptional regulator n=1 Tax=Saccharothrix xinjiangensis TaxID=204798 RepID=A0ABV9YAW7_9PSEU
MLGVFALLVRAALAVTVLAALLAGLPWALTHFVGLPLPDHLPTWAEVQGVLLGPMTTTFLLDFIACVAWLVWASFTLDVARCVIHIAREARMPDLSEAGPVQRIAAALIGAVLISLLGQRANLPVAPLLSAGLGGTDVVAAAPAWNQASERSAAQVRPAAHTAPHRAAPDVAAERPAHAKSAVVLAHDPETGVHDSLWRMAERTLGDGNRWPEIYELNKGKSQPNGGTFTRPSLVFPGEEMALPDDVTVPAMPPAQPSPQPAPPPTTATPPSTSPPHSTTQVPTTTQAPRFTQPPGPRAPSTSASDDPGLSWGEELFVGLGLASAVSAALVAARRHNRRRYRPGSGERGDLPVAPVVYQLRLAHLRADHEFDPDGDDDPALDRPGGRPRRAPVPPVVLGDDDVLDDQAPILPIGVRDGREIALDLAAARGLGLLGAGATGAVRALLVAALTAGEGEARVVVPAEDLAALLDRRPERAPLPTSLHVATDLDAALDVLESETLVRVGQRRSTGRSWGAVVLVARTPARQSRRLQAVLDNGSAVGVTGLLLGQWNSGVTAYVRDDGTVSTTTPRLGELLRGTRVFRLGDDHTTDLLALLHHAAPDTATEPAEPLADLRKGGHHDLEILGSMSMLSAGSRLRPEPFAHTRTGSHTDQTTPATGSAHPSDDEPHETAVPEHCALCVPMRINVLGPPRVWWRQESAGQDGEVAEREVTAAFQPRLRELLVFLALHPDGASREALIAALWPTSPPEKTTNVMNTSLSRLRRALTVATEGSLPDIVQVGESRYRLDPDLVEVDHWSFAAAVAARRAATTERQRIETYRRIVDSYTGPLADGMSTEWIETAREAIRRDAIDAVAALARTLADRDPQQTLDLLEVARAFDPHNELIYRDIMRLQERLGRLDSIRRTLSLLTARLTEIDDRPTPQTVELAERLRRRHDDTGDPEPRIDHGHSRAG